jgi:DNA adenine methylase Dam
LSDYIKSPINYIGGKFKLLKHIIPEFPNDINTFVDLFGGAFNVGINVNANKVIYNDIINYLSELFIYWKSTELKEINNYIDEKINEYDLSSTNLDGFLNFRKNYNTVKDIRDLFILLCYSFNYQIRFNNKQEYNSSFGKKKSTMNPNIRRNLNVFVDRLHSGNYEFVNKNFVNFDFSILNKNDFVYCDCPYTISTGVYQDGKRGFNGWSKEDDTKLFNILDELNNRKIRFALSNVFENKDLKNEELIEWANKYNVIHINTTYNGSNYQRKSTSKTDEVLIKNY